MSFCWSDSLFSAPEMTWGHRDFYFSFFPMPFCWFDGLFSAPEMASRHRDFSILKIPMPLTFINAFLNENYDTLRFYYDYYMSFITPYKMRKA